MIPKEQSVEQSDRDALSAALDALKESEDGLSCIIDKNTPMV